MRTFLFPKDYFRAAAFAFVPAFFSGLFFLGHSIAWGLWALIGAILTVGICTYYAALVMSEENRKSIYLPTKGGKWWVIVPLIICIVVYIIEIRSK